MAARRPGTDVVIVGLGAAGEKAVVDAGHGETRHGG